MVVTEDVWNAIELAESFGCVVRRNAVDREQKDVEHIPLTMEPSRISEKNFNELESLELILNKLIHLMSSNSEFMNKELKDTAADDDFWKRLLEIYNKVQTEANNPILLGLHRMDYLLETIDSIEYPRMVEFNTTAASMGGHAESIAEIHRINRYKSRENSVTPKLAEHLAKSVRAYSNKFNKPIEDLCVLTIRETPGSTNFSDQRKVELSLSKQLDYKCPVRRVTYTDLANSENVSISDQRRFFYQGKEVAAFYMRDGYETKFSERLLDPESFTTEELWRSRERVDTSVAVKCPSIQYHLMTNKVFQACFSNESILRKFISQDEINSIKKFIVPMCYLTDWENPLVSQALANPSSYCLKILREGGHLGNIFEAEEVVQALEKMQTDTSLRAEYCLMRMIKSDVHLNTLVRAGKAVGPQPTIAEYGFFGGFLVVDGKVTMNQVCGHLVRVKPEHSHLGGVNVGGACVGSMQVEE